MGSHLRFTCAYHPASNGQVERINAPVKASIQAMIEDVVNHADWDSHLAASLFAYNICVNITTDFTPFFLTYGREARLTIDGVFPAPKFRYIEYAANLVRLLATVQLLIPLLVNHSLLLV